jgi:predicted KAP-like P-loop ATPase
MSLQSWLSARRICTERFFDRYFLLEVPPQQVSEAVIKQIVNASSNKTALLAILEDLRTRKLILDALERLEAEESLKTLADDFPVWEPTTPGTAQSRSIIIPYHAITR